MIFNLFISNCRMNVWVLQLNYPSLCKKLGRGKIILLQALFFWKLLSQERKARLASYQRSFPGIPGNERAEVPEYVLLLGPRTASAFPLGPRTAPPPTPPALFLRLDSILSSHPFTLFSLLGNTTKQYLGTCSVPSAEFSVLKILINSHMYVSIHSILVLQLS